MKKLEISLIVISCWFFVMTLIGFFFLVQDGFIAKKEICGVIDE